jgi:hypothetical protein
MTPSAFWSTGTTSEYLKVHGGATPEEIAAVAVSIRAARASDINQSAAQLSPPVPHHPISAWRRATSPHFQLTIS